MALRDHQDQQGVMAAILRCAEMTEIYNFAVFDGDGVLPLRKMNTVKNSLQVKLGSVPSFNTPRNALEGM